MAKEVFNPWEISGDINYEKLVKQFGLKPIDSVPKSFSDDVLFRRKKVFAHRDFAAIIDAIEHKKPFVMMTGLMPTGTFHIGHMILAKQFIKYQELGAKLYIAVADVEAYNARGQSFAKSKEIAIEQYIKNYIALGLKPENVEIYFQSQRSADVNKSNEYYKLQNALANHATFNEFKAVYGEITPGKMVCALLQASDMLHPQLPSFEGKVPIVIPVGIDQDPHIRLARDMSKRIKEYQFTPLCSTYHTFIPGLGGGKMSSSDPTSFIAVTDDEKTVKKKINKYAFSGGKATLEEHREKGGNPDIDISYQYLTFFESDDEKLTQIYEEYKSGKLLSGEMKALIIDTLNSILKPIQDKRNAITEKDLKKFGVF
ncbi:MAG: tryptophan--tRNA ligase [bacterium]